MGRVRWCMSALKESYGAVQINIRLWCCVPRRAVVTCPESKVFRSSGRGFPPSHPLQTIHRTTIEVHSPSAFQSQPTQDNSTSTRPNAQPPSFHTLPLFSLIPTRSWMTPLGLGTWRPYSTACLSHCPSPVTRAYHPGCVHWFSSSCFFPRVSSWSRSRCARTAVNMALSDALSVTLSTILL